MDGLNSLLSLLGVVAGDVAAIIGGKVGQEITISADLLAAIKVVLAQHAANQGVPIEQVLAEL
jgi:hypothetical protein